jgi:RHH-type transcriptional regulator, rel operon repressor / antitoxin RelB
MYTSEAKMTAMASITIRIPRALKNRLNKLAGSTARTRSWLAAQALEVYVHDQEWQIAAIRRGMAEIDAGRGVPHQRVVRWLRTWRSKRELPPPL